MRLRLVFRVMTEQWVLVDWSDICENHITHRMDQREVVSVEFQPYLFTTNFLHESSLWSQLNVAKNDLEYFFFTWNHQMIVANNFSDKIESALASIFLIAKFGITVNVDIDLVFLINLHSEQWLERKWKKIIFKWLELWTICDWKLSAWA